MYYINMYFFGCFMGYFIETLMKTFFFPSMNNGFLVGPWIPVYGFGILLVILVVDKISQLSIPNYAKVIFSFLSILILITIVEELGGLFIEYVFDKKFWNYQKLALNIGPYISVEMSLLWGTLGILFALYVRPFLDLFIKKIPKFITIGILFLHILDFFVTLLIS